MTLYLSKLMAVADKATDGDWSADGLSIIAPGYILATVHWHTGADHEYVNASHIATFDPPTVKRLLAIAKAAKNVAASDLIIINSEHTPGSLRKLHAALEGVEL